MSERQPIYEPYGPEWVAEMMKHRKADIVGLFQAFATASRPPVDSVGVEAVLRDYKCQHHRHDGHGLGLYDVLGKADLELLIDDICAALTAPADGCPARGANWDSEHNRCEGNCDKLLSEKEG